MNKKALLEVDKIVLRFPYHPDTILQVKEIDGRRWNQEMKFWSVPATVANALHLAKLGFEGTEEIIKKLTDGEAPIVDSPDGTPFKEPIMKLGELVITAYTKGEISQRDQIDMLAIVNRISLKDLIKDLDGLPKPKPVNASPETPTTPDVPF